MMIHSPIMAARLTLTMRIYPFDLPDYLKPYIDRFIRKEIKSFDCHIGIFDQVWEYLMSKGIKEEQLYSSLDTPEDAVIEWN